MNNATIFESIIKKALSKGWLINKLAHQYDDDLNRWRIIVSNIEDIHLDVVFRHYIKPVKEWDHEYDDYHMKFYFEQIIFNLDFAKIFWEDDIEDYMYLIDTSPDWAHDMGDVEHTWVNESQLKKYCDAELKAFKEEHKDLLNDPDKKSSLEILSFSIINKWENPFEFALMELPAYEYHLQQLAVSENRFQYFKPFLD